MSVTDIRAAVIKHLQFQYQNIYDIRDIAEDFVQEAIAIALLRNYDIGFSIILKIASNLAKREHNRRARECGYTSILSSDLEAVEDPSRDALFGGEITVRESLTEKLRMLPEMQRICIEKQLEGIKIKDIAEQLKSTEGTVKSWLFRGKTALRKLMR